MENRKIAKTQFLNFEGWLELVKEIEEDILKDGGWYGENGYQNLLIDLKGDKHMIEEEKEQLTQIIQGKIEELPKIIERRETENKAFQKKREEAFEYAKERYKKESAFKKIIDKIKRKTPSDLRIDNLNLNEINSLYGGSEKDER